MIRTAGQKDFMKSVGIAAVTTGREDRFDSDRQREWNAMLLSLSTAQTISHDNP
jgi:hypothetical protein